MGVGGEGWGDECLVCVRERDRHCEQKREKKRKIYCVCIPSRQLGSNDGPLGTVLVHHISDHTILPLREISFFDPLNSHTTINRIVSDQQKTYCSDLQKSGKIVEVKNARGVAWCGAYWLKMVAPSFRALARGSILHSLGECDPVIGAELSHQRFQCLVLLRITPTNHTK